MSKLKKVLLMCTAYVLVAALAVGGTLAYLQAEDGDVNVMTLGNVKIEQHEYQRAEGVAHNAGESGKGNGVQKGALVPFVQGQKLNPAVPKNNTSTDYSAEATDLFFWGDYVYSGTAGNGLWNDSKLSNVMDKMVFVENTGKTAAYVRTIIAFECSEGMAYGEGPFVDECEFMMNVNGSSTYDWEEIGYITVNDVRYLVMEATYANVLNPGAQAHPSLLQVVLTHNATNEDMEKLGDTYEILVVSQAVQAAGFADAATALDTAFGEADIVNTAKWFGGVAMPALVNTAAELQDAIDAAQNGDIIVLGADIEGDVTVTQKAGVKFTINGNGKTIDGSIIIDGKSARYETAGITIENVNFAADALSADAYINLGKKGDNNTRYTNNVTVSNCTFDYSGAEDKVAIKSYTGGDWNLTVDGCTATAGMHSLVQVTNVEKGLTITNCKANSKNGINLNNTPYLNMSGCEFDTVGYCVRFGVNGATNNGNFTIADSTLTSANDDSDAVIIFRGNMAGATLTITNTTLTGSPEITGNANVVR